MTDSGLHKGLLLNMLPIASGGGLQNALSFLQDFAEDAARKDTCTVLTRTDSEIHKLCGAVSLRTIDTPDSHWGRLMLELRSRRLFQRGQLCFTLFGPIMVRTCDHFVNVNGCAYSNLFYPEIHFWKYLPFVQRQRMELGDLYRRHATALADYWIFETEALRERAVSLSRFPENRVGVVRMAPSSLVSPERVVADVRDALRQKLPDGFLFLFLNSANPNKRIHHLRSVAQAMIKRGERDFCFVTTLDGDDPYTREIVADFANHGLERVLCNIGPVSPHEVSSLIDCVGAMCTFSVLESFSNNFVEAWKMRRPLIVTDADWARKSCGDGALYVSPEHAESCAESLCAIIADGTLRERLSAAGTAQLATYPTPAEKGKMYRHHMETARNLGPCPSRERRRIVWK